MKWHGTLALLLLTVAAGAYVSLVELKRPSPERQAQLEQEIVDLPADRITALDVTSPSGSVTLERQQQAWLITKPVPGRADEQLVSRILMNLSPLRSDRTLAGLPRPSPTPSKRGEPNAPPSKSAFGLEPPKASLQVHAGPRIVSLYFGEATAVGTKRYAMMEGSPRIYTVDGELFDLLNQPAESYRSRAVDSPNTR